MTSYAYLVLSSILFGIGLLGVLINRNVIRVLMGVEIMLNAVNLLFVSHAGHGPESQVIVFFIMMVAAAEVVIGLAIVVKVYHHHSDLDIDYHQEVN
jgi:NADH-quinone oxidoreductase subunit K